MAEDNHPPRIDGERLRALFDQINAFGRAPDGSSYSRPAFSDADMAARRFLADEMEASGLDVRMDAVGTVIGRWGEDGRPAVVIGSHLDTVEEGGAFGGTLGVAVALEAVRALRAAGIAPAHPVEIVATSDQEARFGLMLGAEAMAGRLTLAQVSQAADPAGQRLVDAMVGEGLDPRAIGAAARPAGSLKAFIELHVEQGPFLEEKGAGMGIVETAAGYSRWRVALTGRPAHAASAAMAGRADAFAGLAEIVATIPSVIRIVGREEARVSLGNVAVGQKSLNAVPETARFDLVVHDTDEKRMRTIAASFRALIKRTADARGLAFTIDELDSAAPLPFDAALAAMIEEEARSLGIEAVRMASAARRDASVMQTLCPSALVLLPSRDGAGFSGEERTDWSDVEDGARLMLKTLMRLSGVASDVAETVPAAGTSEAAGSASRASDDDDGLLLGPFLGGGLAAALARDVLGEDRGDAEAQVAEPAVAEAVDRHGADHAEDEPAPDAQDVGDNDKARPEITSAETEPVATASSAETAAATGDHAVEDEEVDGHAQPGAGEPEPDATLATGAVIDEGAGEGEDEGSTEAADDDIIDEDLEFDGITIATLDIDDLSLDEEGDADLAAEAVAPVVVAETADQTHEMPTSEPDVGPTAERDETIDEAGEPQDDGEGDLDQPARPVTADDDTTSEVEPDDRPGEAAADDDPWSIFSKGWSLDDTARPDAKAGEQDGNRAAGSAGTPTPDAQAAFKRDDVALSPETPDEDLGDFDFDFDLDLDDLEPPKHK